MLWRVVAPTLVVAALLGCTVGGGERDAAGGPDRGDVRELGQSPADARWVHSGEGQPEGEPPEASRGRELERADWELAGVTPDGRRVDITVEVGSGCHAYAATMVDETDDRVRIVAWRESEIDPPGCAMIMQRQRVEVSLAARLGERALQGCGGDCETPADRGGVIDGLDDATGSVVVGSRGPDRAVALAPDGAERMRLPGDAGGIRAVGAGVLAHVPDVTSGVVVTDAATGAHRWTHPRIALNLDGVVAAGDALLISADDELRAFDAADGRLRWVADVAPQQVAIDADAGVAVAVVADGKPEAYEAATDVIGFDLDDGTERWHQHLPGGPALEQLALADGVAVVTVAGGRYALDTASGDERWRQVPTDTHRIHADTVAAGAAIATRFADTWTWHAADTGQPFAQQKIAGRPSPLVPLESGGVITGEEGVLTRRDADGDVVWRHDLRAGLGDAVLAGDELIVGTAVGAVNLALDDGELRWWHND